jgi:hypothetical protein
VGNAQHESNNVANSRKSTSKSKSKSKGNERNSSRASPVTQSTPSTTMITDAELNSLTTYFGMLSVGLILAYSVLESNFRED